MNIINENSFEERYEELYYLLASGFAIQADNDEFDEEVVLDDYLQDLYPTKELIIVAIKTMIQQIEEVLQFDPFPEELIAQLANTWSPVETRKEWLEKILPKLKVRVVKLENENTK